MILYDCTACAQRMTLEDAPTRGLWGGWEGGGGENKLYHRRSLMMFVFLGKGWPTTMLLYCSTTPLYDANILTWLLYGYTILLFLLDYYSTKLGSGDVLEKPPLRLVLGWGGHSYCSTVIPCYSKSMTNKLTILPYCSTTLLYYSTIATIQLCY